MDSTKKNWHWIYTYGFVSIFAGTYILVYFFEKTFIPLYLVILFIATVALSFVLLIKKRPFKRIPMLPFPFFFLSVFGIGVNIATLLLFCNYYINIPDSLEAHLFSKNEFEIIKMTAYTTEKGEKIFDFTFIIPFESMPVKKRVHYSTKEPKINNFLILTKKGFLGYKVITSKEML